MLFRKSSTTIILLYIIYLCSRVVYAQNKRPIVGIMSQPSGEAKMEYIAASYVKWVESAGGRVVPLAYNAPIAYYKRRFKQINGLLFPGGDARLNAKARYLYKLAVQENDNGSYFPIWGTCLGFEWLLQLSSGDSDILDVDVKAWNISLPLSFTTKAAESKLFKSMPRSLFESISKEAVTLNNHNKGIHPKTFYDHPKLSSFYQVLALNQDRNSVPFVSAIEALDYPFFGLQFHPEKNPFEWGTYPNGIPYEAINHSSVAIEMSQYFGKFFVSLAKKNMNHFYQPEEEKSTLIYNFQKSMKTWPGFVESYMFPVDSWNGMFVTSNTAR